MSGDTLGCVWRWCLETRDEEKLRRLAAQFGVKVDGFRNVDTTPPALLQRALDSLPTKAPKRFGETLLNLAGPFLAAGLLSDADDGEAAERETPASVEQILTHLSELALDPQLDLPFLLLCLTGAGTQDENLARLTASLVPVLRRVGNDADARARELAEANAERKVAEAEARAQQAQAKAAKLEKEAAKTKALRSRQTAEQRVAREQKKDAEARLQQLQEEVAALTESAAAAQTLLDERNAAARQAETDAERWRQIAEDSRNALEQLRDERDRALRWGEAWRHSAALAGSAAPLAGGTPRAGDAAQTSPLAEATSSSDTQPPTRGEPASTTIAGSMPPVPSAVPLPRRPEDGPSVGVFGSEAGVEYISLGAVSARVLSFDAGTQHSLDIWEAIVTELDLLVITAGRRSAGARLATLAALRTGIPVAEDIPRARIVPYLRHWWQMASQMRSDHSEVS